jgi:SAM-dependent methyltransferase
MAAANDTIIAAWNTVLFDKFSRFRHLVVDGVTPHSDEALARHGPAAGARALDVGCGFGDTTRQIAQRVGERGEVLGVDCAPKFIALAEQEANRARARNAAFFVADVQTDDLRGPYDFVFSRFGTLFFTMPGAAMRNIRKALKPGGTLTMIVWRKRDENPWLHDAEVRVRQIVPVVDPEDSDQVHCGPGPFSMAGADMVSALLHSAGYERISVERFDADICIGRDMADAIEFAMALGPAGEIMRLAGPEGERRKPEVIAALRETLERYARHDGVWAPSSTWIVTARNPRA